MTLESILVRQAGVVTLAQAVACGVSADTVRRRVRAGVWRELHPCVYLVGGHRVLRRRSGTACSTALPRWSS